MTLMPFLRLPKAKVLVGFCAVRVSLAGLLSCVVSSSLQAQATPQIEFVGQSVKVSRAQIQGGDFFAGHSPKPKKNPRLQISGIKCVSSKHCIVVADESIALQQMTLDRTGSVPTINVGLDFVDKVTSIDRARDKHDNFKEIDFEGVAATGAHLYVTGSWGNKRKKGTPEERNWALWRFPIDVDGRPSGTAHEVVKAARLKELVSRVSLLRHFSGRQLQCHGLNIEGLAARNGDLLFGLRSPTFRSAGIVMIMRVPIKELFDETLSVEKIKARTHFIRLQQDGRAIPHMGIRALEAVDDRILIVSGDAGVKDFKSQTLRQGRPCGNAEPGSHSNPPAVDRDAAPFRIWVWQPGEPDAEMMGVVQHVEDNKLEGIAVLPSTAGVSGSYDVILAFDGKKAVNGNFHVARNVKLKP